MAARIVLSFGDEIVREVELARPVTVVGRHPECDVVIEHPATWSPPEPSGLEVVSRTDRTYGDTGVAVLRLGPR